ncbi:hypothetical protein [Saccharothrix sp. ALI-22-I]|uniref:hypothetical protein n=1 Tax=Saccharothrix sp. ALI-22-I TaxID=1933778 RepID=UPI001179D7C5|nr:hypothetical protein [Saccharothrix sp. ALI-22-I]
MTSMNKVRRRLTGLFTITLAMLFTAALVAAPAHATYGPPQPVDLNLRGTSSTGLITPVGRLVGSVQFDDGNSYYRLDAIACRQSSYVEPTIKIDVNGALHQWFSSSDGIRRPEVCGGHGMSGAVNVEFAYSGIIYNIKVTYEGLYFEGSTAKPISKSRTYDNPFN